MPPMEGMKMMNAKANKTFDLTNEISHLQNTVPMGEKWVIEITVSGEEVGKLQEGNFEVRKKTKAFFISANSESFEGSLNKNRAFKFKSESKLDFIR